MDTWVSFKLWSAVLFTILWAGVISVIIGPYLKEDFKDDVKDDLKEADSADDTETTKTF
jgi:uncharacterized membrane protein YraQ (UPF0718 family)